MKYFIGNWKANKNMKEMQQWVDSFSALYKPQDEVTLGICPPFPFLGYMKWKLENVKNVFIAAQTLSSHEEGSFTGDVTAKTLAHIVNFSIIGHSERRKSFGESDADLALKVVQAKKYGIEPVYCVRDEKDAIPEGVKFIAYEPVAAIGTGQNESLVKVLEMKRKMPLPDDCVFIYGGSVNEKNIKEYLVSDEIDGFLIGKASLNPETFLQIAG